MNIQEKYSIARKHIKHGDIVLFRGKHLLAKTIQFFDSAYYNHVGVIFKSENHFMILDSNGKGVKPDFLSERMNKYTDFCILSPMRSIKEVETALDKAFQRGDTGTKYDFLLLPRIALVKKLGIDLTGLGSEARDICSEFTRYYTNALNISCYKEIKLITPQDFIRCRDKSEISLLFDNPLHYEEVHND